MKKYSRLFSFITLVMFALNIVIAQPVLATENGPEVLESSSENEETNSNENTQEPLVNEDVKASEDSGNKSEVSESNTRQEEEQIMSEGEDFSHSSPKEPGLSEFTGALNYGVFIETPPGRGGLDPSISLKYQNSNHDNWMGVGWNMPLGSIERSMKKGLNYNGDEFNVYSPIADGEMVDRTEWGSGYYGLKIESDFTKFHNLNPKTDGWVVTTREGVTYYFGTTDNSRQSDAAKGIFKWCLDKIEDIHENSLKIEYLKDSGQIYPHKIIYSDSTNATLSKLHQVDFYYDDIPNALETFSTHFSVKNSKRLKTVNVTTGGEAVRCYTLHYKNSDTTSRFLLTEVKKYGDDAIVDTTGTVTNDITASQLPPLQFEYDTTTISFTKDSVTMRDAVEQINEPVSSTYPLRIQKHKPIFNTYGDFDGDGVKDYIYGGNVHISSLNKTFTNAIPYVHGMQLNYSLGDFNGDGKSDVFRHNDDKGYNRLYLSNGDGTFNSTNKDVIYYQGINFDKDHRGPFEFRIGDFNGDGLSDLFFYDLHGKGTGQNRWYYSNGDGSFKGQPSGMHLIDPQAINANPKPSQYVLGDFNGDRKTDLLFYFSSEGYARFFYSNGIAKFSRYDNPGPMTVAEITRHYRCTTGDFNGDGLTDIMFWRYDSGRNKCFLSTGDGNFVKRDSPMGSQAINGNPIEPSSFQSGDFNGDGLSDMVFTYAKGAQSIKMGENRWFISWKNAGPNQGSKVMFKDDWGPLIPRSDFIVYSESSESNPLVYKHYACNPNTASDLSGNGYDDIYCTFYKPPVINPKDPTSNKPSVYRNTRFNRDSSVFADQLKVIKGRYGATYTITYKSSAEFQNDALPTPKQIVASIQSNDGNGVTSLKTYSYEGGVFDKKEVEFRGFKKVTHTNPNGTTIETTFHQDKFLNGKKKLVVVKSNAISNPEISRTTYTWEPIPETNTWGYLKLNKKETILDGNTAYRSTETYHRYNPENGYLEKMTVTGTKTDGTVTDPIVNEDLYENLDTAGWMWRLKEGTITGRVDATTPSGVVRKTSYTYYSTTNADGTFGDLQYEDHYSDATNFIRTEFKYDSYGNVTSQIDPKGYITTYEYDLDTHTYPEKITNPKGHVIQKKWDYRFGIEKSITDANGHTTTLAYDPLGRIIQTDYPDGGQILMIYDDTATPNWIKTRQKENATDYMESINYLDGFGRTIQTVSKGTPSDTGSARFIISKTHYDNMGRVWLSTGPFHWDANQYLTWSEHSQYPTTLNYHYKQIDYDVKGRPLKIEMPDSDNTYIVTTIEYKGFDTTITDSDGNKTSGHKDHQGRTIQMTEHHPTDPIEDCITRYEHNAVGGLICVKNALWSETNDTTKTKMVITYNNLGKKTMMQDPDMGKWTYIYDANGNILEQLDSKGQKSVFTYDEINRILTAKKFYPSGSTHAPEDVIYEYDQPSSANGIGRLSMMKNGTSLILPITGTVFQQAKTVYDSYDTMGRVLKESKTIRGNGERYTEYKYDLADNIKEIAYPHAKNGKKFNTLYTFYIGTGLVKDVDSTLNGQSHVHFATLSDYTPSGNIGKVTFGNGVITDYTYDDFSFRLHHILTQKGTAVLMDKEYFYYHSGNVKSIDDKKNAYTRSYTYDHLHRLLSEHSTALEKFKPMELTYIYDDTNLMVPMHAPVNIQTIEKGVSKDHLYKYDENGNTIESWDFRFPKNAVKRFIKKWTPDNMPKKVEMGRTDEEELRSPVLFKYDGEGTRVIKSEKKKGVEDYDHMYYYYNHYEVQERDGKTQGKRYVFAGNLRLARYLNGTHIAYFHKDHLGSTGVTTDVNGKVTETTDYLPYGGNRSHTGIVHSDYKFTDQEKDTSVGLYNYVARLYDPMIGRFISPDPYLSPSLNFKSNMNFPDFDDSLAARLINPQKLNRFSYCLNNPLKYIDPLGLFEYKWEKTIEKTVNNAKSAINAKSIKQNKEWGCVIVKDTKTGNYAHTDPVTGDGHFVNVEVTETNVPEGSVPKGKCHSHGDYSNMDPKSKDITITSDPNNDNMESEKISIGDKVASWTDAAAYPGFKDFIFTPSNKTLIFDPYLSDPELEAALKEIFKDLGFVPELPEPPKEEPSEKPPAKP